MAQAHTVPGGARTEDLEAVLRGPLLRPGDGDYDVARAVYNGMIDRSPALIARCHNVADVMAAVRFGAQEDIELAVRGGGHNGAGLGTCDDGLVIDLSPMRGVRIDPRARIAQVEGGALLGDLDHAGHAFGLATPTGIMSTTGVGGLTLGGGLGNLTRRYGLTVDSLLSADVVLADGRLVTADANQHPDLFWALRGGGGNFGAVTSFLFRLHPVSMIVGGPTLWHLDDAQDVLRAYAEFLPAAPADLNGWFAFLTVPPAPPFPEELHGRKMCGIVWCWTGPEDGVHQAVAPMIEAVAPALHGIHPMPYPALQSAFDALYPAGDQWYWRADFFKELPADAIALHAQHAAQMPTPQSGMHLYPIDGAAHRVGAQDTAFSYRDATWAMVIAGVDPDPANAERLRQWCVDYWEALHPYSAGGAYVNMMMDEGEQRVRDSYRQNYERLAAVKAVYDPDNLFHVNQNIRPARR